jgi:hypothetical protein
MTGQKLPSPGSVTVSVLNGTGVYNQATTTSAALQALGVHTVGVGDTPSVGVDSETVVYFQQKTAADQAAAETVAASLSGAVITALGPTTDGAQVTVVTGSQFSVNPPAAAPASTGVSNPAAATATTATTVAPSTTTTTEASTGDFQGATPAVTPLQPWDPRSCTASGGEGP